MTDELMEHSTRSPSGAHGWRRCPGKINAEKGLPDRVGIEAALGTMFHDYADIALSANIHPLDLPLGEERVISGHLVAFTEQMTNDMVRGWDFVMGILAQYPDAILFVEERVVIEPWTLEPGGFGTSDCCIVIPSKRWIIVFDWKYGNVPVSPIKNDQLTIYGLGCWNSLCGELFGWDYADIRVDLIIEQPRVPGAGGTWPTTMEALIAEGEEIILDAAATYNPNAMRIAGEKQCRHCKARRDCKELAAYNMSLCQLKFSDIEEAIEWGALPPILPSPSEWTPEHRAYVWLHRDTFKNWFNSLHDAIIDDLRAGRDLEFVKIIMGRAGDRKWREKDTPVLRKSLVQLVGKKAVKESLITPAETEKALKKTLGAKLGEEVFKEEFGGFITQADGKPKLVPATAPGEAVPPLLAQFDVVEEIEG